ncbi:hypothetical protein H6G47_10140 [Aphanizomenon flos-aquae FACHB-1416]|uniref:hypothetical protein n=1 Tax=Aphanizomenon flos-aquae TaxID=1176 RepID=UPI001680454D|nr:hypothetical protein [Aphanizomenon flos-aquae]MBD2390010.1 hypothetical protein [Aphanizomenon flos-aquae FACHB-1171]MBD2555689.1 hypothetical protein [Aphanizomenon flos-aquae FACHB-1290]MBD2656398.1 hypothetical protein [Aphanizomenon flos-aquae FACHB-1265]MBD2674233.1 hypothetical protein [Aphanizomenon flos-aquae FACHB-1416]MBD2696198.1 hypothetical protein [Aphanizomenon flos-aquae FACHB-1287]
MLKTSSLFLALSLSPLILFSFQPVNQAQVSSPSKGNAGGMSGGVNPYPSPSPQPTTLPTFRPTTLPTFRPTASPGPSKGNAGGTSGGVNPTPQPTTSPGPSKGNAGGTSGNPNQQVPRININFTPISKSPNITTTTAADGSVTLGITPVSQNSLNQAFRGLVTELASPGGNGTISNLISGGSNAQSIVTELTNTFATIGVSPQLSRGLLESLANLLSPVNSSIKRSYRTAKLPENELLTNTKALRASLTIAQVNATASVDINKLSIAITGYNNIVNESSPKVLLGLSQNQDFVEIGRVLKKLRAAID